MIQEKILHLLNIRSHESGMVKQLFLVEFFLVTGCAFLFVSANAIFLSVYHIIELPKAFFITGIFLLIFNRLYSNAEHRVTTRQLLYGIIIVSIVATIFIRIGMMFPALTWMPYVLLIWYNVVYLLTGLIFWGLAAMLFNVRESKRIFTIIGAGDIPAKLLGYLSVSLLAPYIGLGNMLWIAVAFFMIALLFAQKLFNMPQISALQLQHHEHPNVHSDQKRHRKAKKISGANLILNIAVLSLLSFLALILIDFTFLAEVKVKYHTDIELAWFLGIFFAFGRILAVILKVTLSSRLISRIGLAGSLLLSPVILFIFTAFILFVSHANTGFHIFLYLFGIMALLTEILKSTVQEPVFLVLFQPLKPDLRLKGHVIAKGYILSIAMIIVGGWLVLYLEKEPQIYITSFGYVLAGILLLWAGSVFLVKKEYLITLHGALKSGFFRGNELFLKNNIIISLLKKKTESDKPAETVYALDLLEKSGFENIDNLLTTQLKKEDPFIIQYAINRIILRKHTEALPVIERLLSTSPDHNILAKCIQAISKLDTDSKEKLEPYLHSEEITCKRAAIIGLLQCGDLEALLLAGHHLLDYIYSPDARERILGAEIIGATGEKKFYKTLIKLMNDKSIAVQKQAIESAGSIQNELLIPSLIQKLRQKETAKNAIGALIKYGDAALDLYKKNMAKR